MTYKRKTSCEKLNTKKQLKIVNDPKGRGKILIPKPTQIISLIKQIPRGKLTTIELVREKLARDYKVDLTCPLVTGIFLRLIAECEEEKLNKGVIGEDEMLPYWRVLRSDGSLNNKFPGGVELQAERLKREGFKIVARHRKLYVDNYREYLDEFN